MISYLRCNDSVPKLNSADLIRLLQGTPFLRGDQILEGGHDRAQLLVVAPALQEVNVPRGDDALQNT